MTILSFCQNDSHMGESLWQKDRMVTHILFDLCLFKNFSPVKNFSNQSLGIISSIQKTIRWRYDHHQMILQSVPTTNQPSSVTRGHKKMTGDRQRETTHEICCVTNELIFLKIRTTVIKKNVHFSVLLHSSRMLPCH